MTVALFLGRFQPFHFGHLGVVKRISEECESLIIGIGSANKSHTRNNPFTFDERKMMIDLSLEREKISNCAVVAIDDINNYPKWVSHVLDSVPKFDVLYTGNPLVRKLFEDKGYKVEVIEKPEDSIKRETSASKVRKMMKDDEKWEDLCPDGTREVIDVIKGAGRVKSTFRPKTPLSAADSIIELYNEKDELLGIPLIERKYPPLGWAIPGGFQDVGESLERTAIREAKEEISLDITLVHQLKTYSDPERDPRRHVNSTVFVAKSYGTPKAADDAKTVKVFSLDELKDLELAFDHNKILDDYLEWRKKNY